MRAQSDFEADIARYVLGVLREQDLPGVATQARLEGRSSLAVGALAGGPPSASPFLIRELFDRALRDMGMNKPAAEKAVYALRAFWLHKLAARDVDAFDTLGRLLKEVYYPHRSLATRPDERLVGEALVIARLVAIYSPNHYTTAEA